MIASVGPSPKVRKRSNTRRIAGDVGVDLSRRQQLAALVLAATGSPTLVVPPPISTIGLCPACCSRRSSMIWTRLPTWRRRRGRVEADIAGHDLPCGERVERRGVGDLVDIAALVEQLAAGDRTGTEVMQWRLASLACGALLHARTMQLNLVPHPATPPADPPFKVWVERRSCWRARRDRDRQHLVRRRRSRRALRDPPDGRAGARRRTVEDDLLRGLPAAPGEKAYREWNFAPSGAVGRLSISRAIARAWTRCRGRPPPYIRHARTISPGGRWRDDLPVPAERMGARPVRSPRGEGRHQILLGAGASGRRQARFPRPGLLRRSASVSRQRMNVRYRPPARRPRAARAAGGQARRACSRIPPR